MRVQCKIKRVPEFQSDCTYLLTFPDTPQQAVWSNGLACTYLLTFPDMVE